MIDPKFEVPDQVRDMALRSVEQAEKAVSSFMEFGGQIRRHGAGPDDGTSQAGPCDFREEFEGIVRACPQTDAGQRPQ